MTEEEEKAIKDCDSIFICLDDAMSEDSANDYRKSYKILKNLIEKQSKEIEELKDESKEYQIGFAQGCYERDLDWKDKIKAKIEIRKEEKEKCKDSIEEKYLLREIYILQSLLRKEFPVTITKEELEKKRWKE